GIGVQALHGHGRLAARGAAWHAASALYRATGRRLRNRPAASTGAAERWIGRGLAIVSFANLAFVVGLGFAIARVLELAGISILTGPAGGCRRSSRHFDDDGIDLRRARLGARIVVHDDREDEAASLGPLDVAR